MDKRCPIIPLSDHNFGRINQMPEGRERPTKIRTERVRNKSRKLLNEESIRKDRKNIKKSIQEDCENNKKKIKISSLAIIDITSKPWRIYRLVITLV